MQAKTLNAATTSTKPIDKLKREKTESPATSKSSTPVPPSGSEVPENTSGRSSRMTRRKESEPDQHMSNNNMDECSIPVLEEAPAIIPETAEIPSVVEQPVAESAVEEVVKVVELEPIPANSMDFQPLDTLIQAAAQLNPKEFELPYEFMEPVPFPGTDKSIPRSRKGKRKPHELDNGFVPLPAKLCHECQKYGLKILTFYIEINKNKISGVVELHHC